jgi:hypothetical protein
MVAPILIAMMAAKALGTGQSIMDAERQKAFNAAILEGQLENLDDQITEQKLDSARKTLTAQGKGVVKAGAAGVQFTGSAQAVVGQDVFDVQLAALRQIRDLKFQKTMTQLKGASTQDQLTQQQIGAAISGAASIAKTAGNASSEADFDKVKE